MTLAPTDAPAASPALTNADRGSLQRLRAAGRSEPTRPAWATDDELARLTRILNGALAPVGRKGAAILLDRLFAVVPIPRATPNGTDPLEIYIDELQDLPGDVLARAVSAVIRRWRWRSAPLVGDIATEAQTELSERLRWWTQLRILRLKPLTPEAVEHTPEAEALEAARRYAMLEASEKHRGEPWPDRAAAIIKAFTSAGAAKE